MHGKKDASVMELTICRTATESLHEALQSLGYYPIKTADRTSEWRRSHYHLYTYPFGKKGIKLSLHKDQHLTLSPNKPYNGDSTYPEPD
jgi:hypothetical protein